MQTDHFMSLAELGGKLPGNPSQATIWRWTRRGLLLNGERVRLRARRLGRRLYVTSKDVDDFIAKCSQADRAAWREREREKAAQGQEAGD